MNQEITQDEIIRVNIHRNLLDEFKNRKENYEKKIGYKINGGTPIISQICAEILKRERTGNKNRIIIEIHKIKGLKRVKAFLI